MPSNAHLRQSRRQQLEAQRLAQARTRRRRRITMVATGLVALVVVVGLGIWGFTAANRGGSDLPPNANPAGNGLLLGPEVAQAPTLEVFADFGCSACAGANFTMGPGMTQLAQDGQLNVVYHLTSGFANSRDANIAAACADFQGKFIEFKDQLYELYANLDPTALRQTIPAAVGLTGQALTDYQTCFDTRATSDFVAAQAQAYAQADRKKVSGTPSFLLNGERINERIYNPTTGAYDADLLRAVLAG
jgi:protein-disulfide isomerase